MRCAVRAQFRMHASESDPAKIDSLKLNAMSGLANYLTMESLRSEQATHTSKLLILALLSSPLLSSAALVPLAGSRCACVLFAPMMIPKFLGHLLNFPKRGM